MHLTVRLENRRKGDSCWNHFNSCWFQGCKHLAMPELDDFNLPMLKSERSSKMEVSHMKARPKFLAGFFRQHILGVAP